MTPVMMTWQFFSTMSGESHIDPVSYFIPVGMLLNIKKYGYTSLKQHYLLV